MPRQTTEIIFVHCSATKPSMDIDAKEIDRWHRERGFLKIGYHFVIKRDGTKEIGRQLMEAEADVNVPDNNFTKEQFLTLKNLLLDLKEQFPDAKIMGHNEVSSKACPSFDVQKWLYENEFVKPVQITTPEEKELLEKKRKEYVGEQLELFIKKEQ